MTVVSPKLQLLLRFDVADDMDKSMTYQLR